MGKCKARGGSGVPETQLQVQTDELFSERRER